MTIAYARLGEDGNRTHAEDCTRRVAIVIQSTRAMREHDQPPNAGAETQLRKAIEAKRDILGLAVRVDPIKQDWRWESSKLRATKSVRSCVTSHKRMDHSRPCGSFSLDR